MLKHYLFRKQKSGTNHNSHLHHQEEPQQLQFMNEAITTRTASSGGGNGTTSSNHGTAVTDFIITPEILGKQHQQPEETRQKSLDSEYLTFPSSAKSKKNLSIQTRSKLISPANNVEVRYSATQIMGTRHNMEDIISQNASFMVRGTKVHVLAVFDGHGTDECALYCQQHLSTHLQNHHDEFEQSDVSEWDEILRQCILELGNNWLACLQTNPSSGSCAAIALIYGLDIICANIGDCRMILSHPDLGIIQLSHDHRPNDPEETERIIAAGGFIENGRIGNVLSPSRAFGDADLRNYTNNNHPAAAEIVIHDPHIVHVHVDMPLPNNIHKKSNHVFAVIASDGVFDVMTNKEVCQVVCGSLKKHPGDIAAASRLLARAAGDKNNDDISCFVVEWKI
jgi:protein phosphatase 2C family protein 2/3